MTPQAVFDELPNDCVRKLTAHKQLQKRGGCAKPLQLNPPAPLAGASGWGGVSCVFTVHRLPPYSVFLFFPKFAANHKGFLPSLRNGAVAPSAGRSPSVTLCKLSYGFPQALPCLSGKSSSAGWMPEKCPPVFPMGFPRFCPARNPRNLRAWFSYGHPLPAGCPNSARLVFLWVSSPRALP